MARLKGKVSVITGGAGGIGVAAGRLFAQEGARLMLFLASDESRYCTGGVYMVDGGISAR
jgi:NAD(P)-dependent dehydrogenase (short-subunit alcohol dehydrogenase family)